jgi:hypothetical protein
MAAQTTDSSRSRAMSGSTAGDFVAVTPRRARVLLLIA